MSSSTVDVHAHGHSGDDGHGHDAHQQHHFATMEQQFDTTKIGMWLFLATEVLLFGGLFVGFGLMQGKYPREFFEAHHHLQRGFGALNTVVLLISSWTMVMAVSAAQKGDRKKQVLFLSLTIFCACIFLGVKYFEYSHKIHDGLLPGKYYTHGHEDLIKDTHGYATFFSFYFMMTGLHGIHILAGIGLLSWILMRARRGEFSSSFFTPVDLVGLYWHLVDLIWIYLFPLFYLIQ
jgi:cytochrome c oxidase subunit 3